MRSCISDESFVFSMLCQELGLPQNRRGSPFSKPAGDKHKALRGSRPKTPREA